MPATASSTVCGSRSRSHNGTSRLTRVTTIAVASRASMVSVTEANLACGTGLSAYSRPMAIVDFAALPIVLQDERLSTAAVTRGMIEDYDMSRAKRAERVDAAAAAWILESALARLR